jgi:hypothetical protein
MATITRTTDAKARISLPKAFANSTVIIEQVSDTEVRIRKAKVVPLEEVPFSEESPLILTERERDAFLEALDNPPPPNRRLRRAAAKYLERHGRVAD